MANVSLSFLPDYPAPEEGAVFPPRSRLFALEPIGIGTPEVEGLTSYVTRLAAAHSVSPRRLVRTEFASACPELAKYRRSGPFFNGATRSANGLYRFSEMFVEAVEKLCRVDVLSLTLLPLKALLPFNGPKLFPLSPRWCPACYTEMLQSGKGVYLPLAWSLDHYHVCHRHSCDLVDCCPVCGKTQWVIPKSPVIGCCCHCGSWLGGKPNIRGSADSFDLWLAKAISEILAALPVLGETATRENFVLQLNSAVTMCSSGSRRRFCLNVGIRESTFQYILSGDKCPTISVWLEIAYGMGIGPVAFLTEKRSSSWSSPLRRLPRPLRQRAERHCLPTEQRLLIEADLRKIIESGGGRMSVCDLARKWNVSSSRLRYSWPEHCRKISACFRVRGRTLVEEGFAKKCELVIRTVDELVARGIYPGQPAMVKALKGSRVSLAHPGIREVYKRQMKSRGCIR